MAPPPITPPPGSCIEACNATACAEIESEVDPFAKCISCNQSFTCNSAASDFPCLATCNNTCSSLDFDPGRNCRRCPGEFACNPLASGYQSAPPSPPPLTSAQVVTQAVAAAVTQVRATTAAAATVTASVAAASSMAGSLAGSAAGGAGGGAVSGLMGAQRIDLYGDLAGGEGIESLAAKGTTSSIMMCQFGIVASLGSGEGRRLTQSSSSVSSFLLTSLADAAISLVLLLTTVTLVHIFILGFWRFCLNRRFYATSMPDDETEDSLGRFTPLPGLLAFPNLEIIVTLAFITGAAATAAFTSHASRSHSHSDVNPSLITHCCIRPDEGHLSRFWHELRLRIRLCPLDHCDRHIPLPFWLLWLSSS